MSKTQNENVVSMFGEMFVNMPTTQYANNTVRLNPMFLSAKRYSVMLQVHYTIILKYTHTE